MNLNDSIQRKDIKKQLFVIEQLKTDKLWYYLS